MRIPLWLSATSAGRNSACRLGRLSAAGGTATFGVRQRSGLTPYSTGPAYGRPVNANVRPLNTPSSSLQHAFGHIAFKHVQPWCVKCRPIKKTRLTQAGTEAMRTNLRGNSRSAPLRPRQGVLGLRTCQTVQDLKSDSKCHGRSRPKFLADKGGRSVQAIRG